MALETGEKRLAEALKEPAAGERTTFALTRSEGQEFHATEEEARLSSRLDGMIIGNGNNVVALGNGSARVLDTATKSCNNLTAAPANPSPSAVDSETTTLQEFLVTDRLPSRLTGRMFFSKGDNVVPPRNFSFRAFQPAIKCRKKHTGGAANSSPSAVDGKRMVTLTSSEDQELLVTEAGVRPSPHLAGMNGNGNNIVALRNIPAFVLDAATKSCNKHTAAAGERMITLTSSEGQEFLVMEAGARLSPHLAGMIGNGDNVVALHNIPARALDTVTKYFNKHAADANPSLSTAASNISINAAPSIGQELNEWDRELVRGIDDVDALYDLLMAAHFLRHDGLIDTVCKKVADVIARCETPKKIRETFRLPDDLTAAQKEEIRKEYSWAFGADDI